MRILFVALLLAACGATGLPDDRTRQPHSVSPDGAALDDNPVEAESGTRLRAVFWQTADGARQLFHWHDLQRGEDCRFLPASDSTLRCLPGFSDSSYEVGFADAHCTQPIAVMLPPVCERPFAYALREKSFQIEVRPVGERVSVTSWYGGDACQSWGTPPSSVVYSLGALISPEQFVQATPTKPPTEPHVAPLEYGTADGAKFWNGYYDTRLGVACSAELATDGVRRCIPLGAAYVDSTLFADPSCGGSPVVWNQGGTTRYARELASQDDCLNQTYKLFQTAGPASAVYRSSGTACLSAPQPQDYDTLGREIAPSEMAPLALVQSSPPTRLRRTLFDLGSEGPQGFAYPMYPWHDTRLDVDCTFGVAADGVPRCLASQWTGDLPGAVLFADAGCTMPVVVLSVSGCGGELPRYVTRSGDACNSTQHVFPIEQRIIPVSNTLYMHPAADPTTCMPTRLRPPFDVFELGPEIPAATFEPAQILVE
jgi:hypothetical protein